MKLGDIVLLPTCNNKHPFLIGFFDEVNKEYLAYQLTSYKLDCNNDIEPEDKLLIIKEYGLEKDSWLLYNVHEPILNNSEVKLLGYVNDEEILDKIVEHISSLKKIV